MYAVGFVVRPLGALIFGHIGDTWGRNTTLRIAIVCMAVRSAQSWKAGFVLGHRRANGHEARNFAPVTNPHCFRPPQIPTVVTGILPTYGVGPYTAGLAAPILLTIMRLLQGLAMGGEFGPAIIYLR